MDPKPKQYVVVLAHADGWGALSANQLIKHLHVHHPELGVHLVVSQATKNKEGAIATKLDDLKTPRELKETNLLEYFRRVDEKYDQSVNEEQLRAMEASSASPEAKAEYFYKAGLQHGHLHKPKCQTFKQLAKRYCADGEVHYTTRGGPKGGEEVGAVVESLEKKYGHGPEVLLSVDTMAILPAQLLEKYQCFSTHPGPLDTVKVEGMQGTLRSLVNQVLYDRAGKPLPASHPFGVGETFIKGTLFMQHPELDKGPLIADTQTFVCPGMCAYQSRDEVYHALIEQMTDRLPILLDKGKRAKLVADATKKKEALDKEPHVRIDELEAGQFATWQGKAVGFPNESKPWGIEVIQNDIVDPVYFKNRMRDYFPGPEAEFEKTFNEVYGSTIDKLTTQKQDRLTDPWAKLAAGDTDITITQYDRKTGKPIAEYKNPPRSK